jgi:hypothetical protein
MSSDPFAALDLLVRQKNSQIPKRQKAAITPPKPRKKYKKPRPSETLKKVKSRKNKIAQEFNTNPLPKMSLKSGSNTWKSRPKSKSLRTNTKIKTKTKNPYLEVDNRKYLEYKMGDDKRKSKVKTNGIGRKKIRRHGKKGYENKIDKERNRDKMETRRIERENKQWYQEEESEDIPIRKNHGENTSEYTAKNRRKR